MARGKSASHTGEESPMLTTELLRFDIDKTTVKPRYLRRKHADHYLSMAGRVLDIYLQHVGKSRQELESALVEFESDSVSYRIIRGLAKMVEKFCQFTPPAKLDYEHLRQQLFDFAEAHRPIVLQPDLVHQTTRAEVLQQFTAEHGALPEDLYGDLPEKQILVSVDSQVTPEMIVRRYNLALAQGMLYRCHHLQIQIWDGYKIIFQYLKLARLMHGIRRVDDHYTVDVDGPVSLFRKSQKYGVKMAMFLPALMLAEKWQMSATVSTRKGQRYFYLNQDCGLSSYYKGDSGFDSSVEEAFQANFTKRETEWQIQREGEIVDLGESVLIPDFKFIHPDGRQVLLEIVGFWTPEYLEKKLQKLRQANLSNLIVAVNETLNCSREDFTGPVIFYKTRLKVKDVLAVLEDLS